MEKYGHFKNQLKINKINSYDIKKIRKIEINPFIIHIVFSVFIILMFKLFN